MREKADMCAQAEKFSLIINRPLVGLFKLPNEIVDFRKLLLDSDGVGFEIQQPQRPKEFVNFSNGLDVWPEVLH